MLFFSTESGCNKILKKGFLYYSLLIISEISTYRFTLNEELFEWRIFMVLLRTFVIKYFLRATHQACNEINIGSGFRTTGNYPYNPEKPLFTDFSMECNDQLFKNKAKNDLPTNFINSEDGLKYSYEKDMGNNLNLNNLKDI